MRDPIDGYYDRRDPFTAVPRASVLSTPYASHAVANGNPNALKNTRLGVIRESMICPPGSKTEEPIVTAATNEIETVLGAHLGATLVESSDPLWQPDPEVEQITTDFRRALARLVPIFMPDLLFRLGRDGQPVFKEFAAAIEPTEFLAGTEFGSGTLKPIDYLVALADLCGNVGGKIMVLGSPKQRWIEEGSSNEEASERFLHHVRPALDRAQERGITVCLEPLPPPEAPTTRAASPEP